MRVHCPFCHNPDSSCVVDTRIADDDCLDPAPSREMHTAEAFTTLETSSFQVVKRSGIGRILLAQQGRVRREKGMPGQARLRRSARDPQQLVEGSIHRCLQRLTNEGLARLSCRSCATSMSSTTCASPRVRAFDTLGLRGGHSRLRERSQAGEECILRQTQVVSKKARKPPHANRKRTAGQALLGDSNARTACW